MTKCQSSMRPEDGKPLIKYKGIHEPKGRVKGFRVEIRPSNSPKVWVGTFDSRDKAMRAFDAAVYLTGKEPYYYIYPENYFPIRPVKPGREYVQTEAKKFADRTDDLKVNPVSFLVDISKACSTPLDAFANLDEFLKEASYLPVSAEQIPALDASTFWEDPKFEVEDTKAGLVAEGNNGVKEAELAAFDKGYCNPDFDVIKDLLDRDPPERFLPCIEGESFIPVYSPSRPSSKRKRDAAEDVLGFPHTIKAVELSDDLGDPFFWENFLIDPPSQSSGWFETNPPGLYDPISSPFPFGD